MDKDVLFSNGDWFGIVLGFVVMRWLSVGCGKDSKLRFLKIISFGDYYILLWLFFDVGVFYFVLCVECEYFIIFFYILVCYVLMFELLYELVIENKNF